VKRLTIIALSLLLAGCILPPPPPWSGDDGVRLSAFAGDGEHVLVFGDSLTYLANNEDALTDQLVAAGYVASVSATGGATSQSLAADDLVEPEPGADITVIALGTNDIHLDIITSPGDIGGYIARIQTAFDRYDAGCDVAVTTVESEPMAELAPLMNDALEEMASVVVADWAAIVADHPEYLLEDGIHHTPGGQAAYRDLIESAVGECDNA
jgi:lysophospholipase L1-like esterase